MSTVGDFNPGFPPVCFHEACQAVAKFRLGNTDSCANHLAWAIRRQVPAGEQATLAVGRYVKS